MNLRDLEYLVALAEHRHFGRAAAACYVSQPTLSTQVRKLESELGVHLFERGSRSVLLTWAGEQVLRRARVVLSEAADIKEIARRAKDPRSGTLRLGAFPTIAAYLMPHVLGEVRRQFPSLELLLFEKRTSDLIASLIDGALDAAVIAMPLHEDSLHVQPLFREDFLLAFPATDPLARSTGPATGGDLVRPDLLLLEEGHCLRDQALEVCRMAGAQERQGFRATSLEMLRHMVASGVGITLLPRLAVSPPVPVHEGVGLREFAAPAPHRDVALVWRRSSGDPVLLSELAGILSRLPAGLVTQLS